MINTSEGMFTGSSLESTRTARSAGGRKRRIPIPVEDFMVMIPRRTGCGIIGQRNIENFTRRIANEILRGI